MASDPEKPRKPLIPDRRGPGRPDEETWTLSLLERAFSGELPAEAGRFEDGRPKGWPTLQLRIRSRPFDVYCDDPTDVTLDGIGIPVVNGRTVSTKDLGRGWYEDRSRG